MRRVDDDDDDELDSLHRGRQDYPHVPPGSIPDLSRPSAISDVQYGTQDMEVSTSQGVHAPEPPTSASASRETSVVSWASETESAILSYGAAAQALTQLGDFFRSNPAPPGLSQDD